ncbi:hypothetical protein Bca4012_068531 [Brassica carinata]|uniref:RING-type E3 ubiquitin transferase n=1 Tax=Brassica carinata TaxID=52824 RepID=A0A8X7VTW6_BRACI|nr:hypothetical protein Bca52824_020748 [Brassica carinata]
MYSEVFQEHFISRKLLQQLPFDHNYMHQQEAHVPDENILSGNVLMVLSILVCGIIGSIGLHYVIGCIFRRSSSFMIADPISSPSTSRGSEANKGIKKEALKMFPVVKYSPEVNLSGVGEECVICLSDFVAGEQVRLLPKCNHGFHVRCIDKWLTQHVTCPKCRHSLVETCQKILGEEDVADQVAATPTESIDVIIAPLESEARVNTFREAS